MEKETRGYYDIDIDEIDIETKLLGNSCVDDLFYIKDLKQRKLFLNSDINQLTVQEFVRHILQFNREDYAIEPADRRPILFYVNSNGGEVDSGFALIDAIMNSKTPVYTINLGFQYSMGFLIGIAGHKRFATKNSKFLMHDGQNYVYDSGMKAQDRMEFNKRTAERERQYILSRSKMTGEEYDSKLRVEYFMFADEAKEKGFVDFIVGEDCDIDAIV